MKFERLCLAVTHFVLFRYVWSWLGHPGYLTAKLLGASYGGFLWWVVMVLNSFLWAFAITLLVIPALKKALK